MVQKLWRIVLLVFQKWNDVLRTQRKSFIGTGLVVLGPFVALCCIGTVVAGTVRGVGQSAGLIATNTPTSLPTATATAMPTHTPAPTGTPALTATPAPTNTPEPPPATPTPNIGILGQPHEGGGVSITVLTITRKAQIGDFQQAADGNIFAIVEVIVETTGRDKAPYNPFYFKVKDVDGFEYSTTLLLDNQALKSGELAQGEKARGLVAFEVKEASTGLVLSYEPIVILGGYEPIKIALE